MIIPVQMNLDSGSGSFFRVLPFDDTTVALELGHRAGGSYRVVHLPISDLVSLAIMVASIPEVADALNAVRALICNDASCVRCRAGNPCH